jgi:hypothetical protein
MSKQAGAPCPSCNAHPILCIVGAVLAGVGFLLMLMSGDPEGRTATLAPWGVGCFLGGAGVFASFGSWALVRWLH